MILSRFLKPKWQHPDPGTRKQALQELDNADPTLIELARQDPDPTVRCAALERLGDLDLLRAIADQDADGEVRAAAQNRYRSLLAGKTADCPSLAIRLERLRHGPDSALAEFLLHQAVEPELRLAALESIDSATALVEIALRDPHPDLRLAALERIHDPECIDQIGRQNRNRDKRLYRRARERLDSMVAEQARAAHLERLCSEMEHLIWDGESGPNAGRFPKLEQEWRDQEATAPPELQERYSQARARFQTERQASAGRRSQRLELVTSLETLLERLRLETEPSAESRDSIRHATQEAPAAWEQLGTPQDADGRRLATRFQQLLQDIHEQERLLHRDQARAVRLREVLEQAEILLQQPSEVHDADLKRLRQRWEGLERPESRHLANELQTRFDGALDKLRARLQRQVQQRDQEWQDIQELARQLETAVENGEVQQATQLQEQARQRLKHNIGLSRAQMAATEERLQNCAGRLGELRDWRRWGTNQAREQLCIAAESLVGLEADPADIAQRIQQARDAWKEMDHHEGAAPKALWKRFNSACERAYAPCQVYFEARVRERQQNLEKKAALCEQLEQFEAATDWQQVDWREADRLHRRAQEQWHKLGPINRADRKNLDRRFQQIMKQLDAHLAAEREREIQRRQQLIQEIQALVDGPNLRVAIETAKRAQTEWHPTVQALPRQEQTLWKSFRAACDAVFARRQAEQQAADDERQTHLARKLALCEELEALSATDDEAQLELARSRLYTLQQTWDEIGPIPKAEQRTLGQRFEAALKRFAHHERSLRRDHTLRTFRQLCQRAALCQRLEALLEQEPPTDAAALAEVQQEWSSLPDLPSGFMEPIQRRFDSITQTLAGAPEPAKALRQQLEQNLARKQIWCICMEIATGVESPPEHTQLRMEYQVARLSASLGGATAKTGAFYDPRVLQEQWYATGVLPAAAAAELDARFLRAAQSWWQREED